MFPATVTEMISFLGRVFAPEDMGLRVVTVDHGRIADIRPAHTANGDAIGGPDAWIIPGLVDLQLNGAFGIDFSDPRGDIALAAAALPHTGVTAFLPTIVSSPPETYAAALRNAGTALPDGAARVLGVHLEGPFLEPSRRGAHEPGTLREPDLEAVRAWLQAGAVRIVTLAPELVGAEALIRELVDRGVIVGMGHSSATWAEADAAIRAGSRLGTHLFNAMQPLHHRDPGLVGRLLAPGIAVSVIADGVHVAPETVRLVATIKPRDEFILVTDGVAALGKPAGRYSLGGREVVSDGIVGRLTDGTLCGAVVPMATALGRLVAAGLEPTTAVRAASTNPARLLGAEAELGHLEVGRVADLVLLDSSWRARVTLVQGRLAHGSQLAERSQRGAGG